MSDLPTLGRRLGAEALGTGFLVIAVVGSGIMGERLAAGNAAVALLANTAATAAALYVLITTLAPLSGAHLNPVVTLTMARRGEIEVTVAALYVAVQVAAAIAGTMVAHAMFGEPLLVVSGRPRAGLPLMFSEFVATFGLVVAILLGTRYRPDAVAGIVAAYIAGAYWFTASTSFANPAVTAARALTDTFAGIRAGDAPGFVIAQMLGAVTAVALGNRLLGARTRSRAVRPAENG